MLTSIVVMVGVLAWGSAVVFRLQPRGNGRVLYSLALGPGVGFGILSLIVFFWRAAGLARPTTLTIVGAGAILWALLRFIPVQDERSAMSAAAPACQWPMAFRVAAGLVCAGSVVVALAGFYAFSERQPNGAWDAVGMWNVRARFLFAGYDFFPDTLQRVTPMSVPYRPLLLPGALAGQAMLLGSENASIGGLTALAFTAALGLLVFALVRSAGSGTIALLAVALTFSARPLVQWAPSQMADIPVAYFLLASAGALASLQHRFRGPRVHPALAGFILGMLVWVKDEGLVLAALILFVAAGFAILEGVPRDLKRLRSTLVPLLIAAAPGLVAALMVQVVWASELTQNVLQGDWRGRLLSPARWSMPVAEVSSMLVGWAWGHDTKWGWAWAMTQGSALLALWYRTKDSSRLLSQVTALMVLTTGCWILTYTVTHHLQSWHIESSLERAVTQIYPTVVVGTLIALDRSRAFRKPENEEMASATDAIAGTP
jgi:hypothetical protein